MADRTISRRPKTDSAAAAAAESASLHLVHAGPDAETIALLRRLLHDAEHGKLAGVVAVGLMSRRHPGPKYDISFGGLAASNPTLAVGAMDVCHMLLRERALEDSGLV